MDGAVLVVDDERFFREAIRDALSRAGFVCVLAESGGEALERAESDEIGVVVLDIQMPGMNGIEVLRRLRETRPLVRVIILSAHTDQAYVLEALRLGAADYLAKPLHEEELVLAVRRALEGHLEAGTFTGALLLLLAVTVAGGIPYLLIARRPPKPVAPADGRHDDA